MKTVACFLLAFIGFSSLKGHAQSQDSTGLPGDNLNLYAVLDLFKSSQNVEDFEKKLNDPANKINNLDLNNDGYIDYIRVVDYGKENLHSLVLQVPVNKTESQDVAVIEVEKKNGSTRVQVVGDEALYGPNYVIEPQPEQEAQVHSQNLTPATTEVVYVDASPWPSVSYIYGPSYVYWNSPWYWGYYPGYWHPWRPYGFYTYNHWWYYEHPFHYYHRIYVNHVPGAYGVYAPHKTTSVYVQKNVTVIKNNSNPQKVGPGQKSMNGNAGGNVAAPHHDHQGNKVAKQQPATDPSLQQQPAKQSLQSTQSPAPQQKQPVSKPAPVPHEQMAKPAPQPKAAPVSKPQRVQQPRMNEAPRNGGGGGGGGMHRGGGGGGGGRRR